MLAHQGPTRARSRSTYLRGIAAGRLLVERSADHVAKRILPGQGGRPARVFGAVMLHPVSTFSRAKAILVGTALFAGATVLAPASASARSVAPAVAEDRTGLDTVLYLIGDAGKPDAAGDPVLRALGHDLARDPARSLAVFLGDNLYPDGLPPEDDPSRKEMQRRLDAQVDVVKASGARGLFVPGNHDWQQDKAEGWAHVRRQGEYIEARGAPQVRLLPVNGCPGPEIVDVGRRLRLILLDTQWWLHPGPKPEHPSSDCRADAPEEVVSALREALTTAGDRHVVVAAHHPLASGGPHGGHFSFRQHLFPLTDLKRGLFIPLPGIGSLYPLARKNGASPQDLAHEANRRMVAALVDAFGARPPLVFASGHEHTLQVLDGPGARRVLVSGTGIYGHTSPVKRLPGALFAAARSGYMRLDVDGDGSVRLVVLEVEKGKKERPVTTREVYSEWLVPGKRNEPATDERPALPSPDCS